MDEQPWPQRRTADRRRSSSRASALVVLALLAGVVIAGGVAWASLTSATPGDRTAEQTVPAPSSDPGATDDAPPADDPTVLVVDGDGDIPGGFASVGDVHLKAIAGLDPALREAVRAATADAAADGIVLQITSGWRSAAYQQQLLEDAVERYGLDEAQRRVATPESSAHVTGDAIDIGPTDAAYWMVEHGSAYGLCQVFANEIWHYELVAAHDGTCPPMRPDAAS